MYSFNSSDEVLCDENSSKIPRAQVKGAAKTKWILKETFRYYYFRVLGIAIQRCSPVQEDIEK